MKEIQEKATPAIIVNGIVDIDELIPYARNARVHSYEQVQQIAASIAEFGVTNPVLVWKNNEIIAGHGRVMAMKLLLERDPVKWEYLRQVDVRRCDDLTDQQRRALILADNKLAENATWDDLLLESEIFELQDSGFDIGLMGFDPDDFVNLPDELEDSVQQTRPKAFVEKIEPADTWLVIGPYRISIARAAFLRWQEEIRSKVGFDQPAILSEICKRIGLKEESKRKKKDD